MFARIIVSGFVVNNNGSGISALRIGFLTKNQKSKFKWKSAVTQRVSKYHFKDRPVSTMPLQAVDGSDWSSNNDDDDPERKMVPTPTHQSISAPEHVSILDNPPPHMPPSYMPSQFSQHIDPMGKAKTSTSSIPKETTRSSLHIAQAAPPNSSAKFIVQDAPFRSGIQRQQKQMIRQTAFLRQSWNRTDFVAVLSFWISFWLSVYGLESRYQLYVFRSLSVLRLMRLLTITSGTTVSFILTPDLNMMHHSHLWLPHQVILQSLKRASSLLVNVLLFLFFAAVLFSIVGVQSFKGSFDRYCVWIGTRFQIDE